MKNLILIFILAVLISPGITKAQYSTDLKLSLTKEKNAAVPPAKDLTISGIFLSPYIGATFPLREFRDNSNTGLNLGVKLEFTSTKIFPFVVGGLYEYSTYEGGDEFKSKYFLGTFKSTITSFGGSVDIILNKYVRSNFTIPFLTFEVKFMDVQRTVIPEGTSLPVPVTESITSFGGGAGFTLFIFDIYGTYTYAKSFTALNINTRFHIPIIRF